MTTQWYACQPSEAMHGCTDGHEYSATRCLPQLQFFDDGAPMLVSIDVLLYGYTTVDVTVSICEVGYYNTDLRQWFISNHDNEHGFVPVAWCYLPDVPSEFEDAVKTKANSEKIPPLSSLVKHPELMTSPYTGDYKPD